ncbi:hypothetical protein [Rhodobium gokarnense]|uniref:Uncharacterized protein n=1 Tax=Rhodobium gokarnense TaxID=364296 RepID=A0ABT3H977_9HYPH|nr:hypothetical protein [Rhodobium gokarnense]MCW2306960.1 hypothetical protein [Rhodobium gokarnense]
MSGENGFGGHRHGVKKNILEGLGGMFVGAAAVLVLKGAFARKTGEPAPQPDEPASDTPAKDEDKTTKASAAKSTARRAKSTRTTPKRAPRKPATGSAE